MRSQCTLFAIGIFVLALAACGSEGNGSSMTFTATADPANAQIASQGTFGRIFAFFFGREVNAAAPVTFVFTDGGTITVKKAVVGLSEVELDHGDVGEMEFEGNLLLDLLSADLTIPDAITVSASKNVFGKVKIKIDDLDDRNGNNSFDNSDEIPLNGVSVEFLNTNFPLLFKNSIYIQGSVDPDGTGTAFQATPFTFTSNIEGRIVIPFSAGVPDANTLIAFFDLKKGFEKGGTTIDVQNAISAGVLDGTFGSSETCTSMSLTVGQKIACGIGQNITWFHDENHNGTGEPGEKRGDSTGVPGGGNFDDTIPHD